MTIYLAHSSQIPWQNTGLKSKVPWYEGSYHLQSSQWPAEPAGAAPASCPLERVSKRTEEPQADEASRSVDSDVTHLVLFTLSCLQHFFFSFNRGNH